MYFEKRGKNLPTDQHKHPQSYTPTDWEIGKVMKAVETTHVASSNAFSAPGPMTVKGSANAAASGSPEAHLEAQIEWRH